jgi:hypothetical protein
MKNKVIVVFKLQIVTASTSKVHCITVFKTADDGLPVSCCTLPQPITVMSQQIYLLIYTLPTFKHCRQSGMAAVRVDSGALAPPTTYRQFLAARGVHSRNCAT